MPIINKVPNKKISINLQGAISIPSTDANIMLIGHRSGAIASYSQLRPKPGYPQLTAYRTYDLPNFNSGDAAMSYMQALDFSVGYGSSNDLLFIAPSQIIPPPNSPSSNNELPANKAKFKKDDGQGNVNIQKPDGEAANLNVTGTTTGTWFSFNNIHNYGNMTIIFQNKDGQTPVDIVVSGAATIYRTLTVNSSSNLNGRATVNSQSDNLPLNLAGAGGQFWFFTSGGQYNGAVIRGGSSPDNFGLTFTGTDRVRIEGVGGDNRIATLQDLANITFMQNPGLMNGEIATGFNG
ncbi:MAG: hypothetical protein K0R14_1944 [Burkholderiales bacterium]|jgi:hypothetical protein|nr:hypothetical protein [Burkholderiales bacterium]